MAEEEKKDPQKQAEDDGEARLKQITGAKDTSARILEIFGTETFETRKEMYEEEMQRLAAAPKDDSKEQWRQAMLRCGRTR